MIPLWLEAAAAGREPDALRGPAGDRFYSCRLVVTALTRAARAGGVGGPINVGSGVGTPLWGSGTIIALEGVTSRLESNPPATSRWRASPPMSPACTRSLVWIPPADPLVALDTLWAAYRAESTTINGYHTAQELRLLQLLSQRYPTITAAHIEMINLHAILALPKGTDHYISDIHGAYEQFDHILRHASGAIRRKINQTFGGELSDAAAGRSGDADLLSRAEAAPGAGRAGRPARVDGRDDRPACPRGADGVGEVYPQQGAQAARARSWPIFSKSC